MAEENDSERTEAPTQQRREDFRKRGQVAQSRELSSVFVVFTTLLLLWALGRFFLGQLFEMFSRSFSDFIILSGRQEGWFSAIKFATIKSALIVGPLALMLWLVNVFSSIVQIGLLNNEEALQFNLTKIDPVSGFKRLFSFRAIVEGAKALVKMFLVGVIVFAIISRELKVMPHLVNYDVGTLIVYASGLLLKLFGWVGLFMLALAGMDYFFQRWELEKKMRMTKQEVKEEIKSREGDPLIRARVRKLQRELASRRMIDDVKKADVIITNPTHIAVALQYSKKMVAPKVIAKGAGDIAERIKKQAREFNVPIVENKPLARTIYKTLKIGQMIPRELYTAVAEVLSYIFRLKNKRTV
ncbi:MAG: flagellar biosynthesis protein FlhB [Bdellovibrionales bacterium RBG_16_40_8]|nr:MAG: flagellar biosynthesis protein FlhB [Bdellovibrionales bacterium RBG_16_40_8]